MYEIAIVRFQQAGLVARPNGYNGTHLFIERPLPSKELPEEINYLTEEDFIARDFSMIYPYEGKWFFRKWDETPGPGPDDIMYEASTLEEAVSIALNYYLGEAVVVNGWVFPIHKHPEWNQQDLSKALAKAKQVTQDELHKIREQLATLNEALIYEQHSGTRQVALSEIWACSLTPISHTSRAGVILWLRRDLKESFTVV